MQYRILFEADKHWGATRPEEQYRSSYALKWYLSNLPVDLFVSLGDFYDTKLLLNSKASVYALRDMNDKANICRMKNIPMRVIRGTLSHDYDQLEAFSNLIHDDKYDFNVFSRMTIEETLPGLVILYAPDENMRYKQYADAYFPLWLENHINMACCHGNFDVVMPAIAMDAAEAPGSNTLVYRYHDMSHHVNGPIIAGHFHNGDEYENLHYSGSPDRWIFGEENQKGYLLVVYDTDTQKYQFARLHNFLETKFQTFNVYTSIYKTVESYQKLIRAVEESLAADMQSMIRIKIRVDNESPDTDTQIANLKFHFGSCKRVRFALEDAQRAYKKAEEHQKVEKMNDEYAFVRDRDLQIPEKVQMWIKRYNHRDYPLQMIEEILKPELENL